MQNVASVLLAQSLSTTSLFALLLDMQKIWDESLMRSFCVLASPHMCPSHGPGGRCRVCSPVISPRIQDITCCLPHSELWHREVLWYTSQKNTWQPQGKTGMVLHGKSRSLSQKIFPDSSCARHYRGSHCCSQRNRRIKRISGGLHHFPSTFTFELISASFHK